MKKRSRVNKKKDAKIFKKTAIRTKLINNEKVVPRGGIRL